MRNLNTKDLFKLMKIMRKAKIKENLLKMKLPKDISDDEYGMMIVFQIIESAPDAEKDIMEFLADIGGVEVKELEEDEFKLLPKIIEHLQGQENFINFLSSAFKSMK